MTKGAIQGERMEIDIDYTKSAQENADYCFSMSKKLKRKAEGARAAIKRLEEQRLIASAAPKKQKLIREITQRKWYEKFNWFTTSNSMLVIGGRSAIQNEQLNSRHFDNQDLFFHADVFGASVVILKGGAGSAHEIKFEAAQFAVCFSRAWEGGMASANAYALKRDQVSKSKEKGSLGTGSFLLAGEREWFKGVPLELCAFVRSSEQGQQLDIVPISTCVALGIKKHLTLKPGNMKKSDAAKEIASRLKFDDIDYIMQRLPPGGASIAGT